MERRKRPQIVGLLITSQSQPSVCIKYTVCSTVRLDQHFVCGRPAGRGRAGRGRPPVARGPGPPAGHARSALFTKARQWTMPSKPYPPPPPPRFACDAGVVVIALGLAWHTVPVSYPPPLSGGEGLSLIIRLSYLSPTSR